MSDDKSYRLRITISEGKFYPEKRKTDWRPVPGARVLDAEPEASYTDSVAMCSILRDESGGITSIMWAIDPSISNIEALELSESLAHHLAEHHQWKES